MKKVAIVTIYGGANYGNKLQMYAVQETLRALGCAPTVLRRELEKGKLATARPKKKLLGRLAPGYLLQVLHSRLNYIFDAKNGCDGKIATAIRNIVQKKQLLAAKISRQAAFDAFDDEFIQRSDFAISSDKLPADELAKFDFFVCGSDQIWNPTYPTTTGIDFLTFAPVEKRVAFSPSFGVAMIHAERRQQFAEWLTAIPHLSVREQQGAEIIRSLTGREALVLSDPTIMLNAEEWMKLARRPDIPLPEKYLLYYFLGDETSEYGRFLAKLAKDYNLELLNLHNLRYLDYYHIDPCGFLWLLAHATLVATDSFHGTVFSILFQRDFIAFERVESGGSMGSRQATLLGLFQLENRGFRAVQKSGNIFAVDFSGVEAVLQRERVRTKEYLIDALATIKKQEITERHCNMRNVGEVKNCNGCTACVDVCPQVIISMQTDAEGFLYPQIIEEQCTECGICLAICPVLSQKKPEHIPTAYAVINKDTTTRMNSSSGGLFALFAKQIIAAGGVVFGAAFDEEFQLIHCAGESSKEIAKFTGSKYVQSNIGTTFQQVDDLLKQGRKVLFSGTPCQIGGLLAQLGGKPENLLTIDIVCHGVPSPKVWKNYLEEMTARRRLTAASFRNKDTGWKRFSMKLWFAQGRPYRKDLTRDPYLRAFLSNLSLRPSCYQCNFKTVARDSDITLADFWAVKRMLPNMDDDRGTSLLLVHSERGAQLLHDIDEHVNIMQVDVNEALANNHAACHSATEPAHRADFFAQLGSIPFSQLVNQLLPITMKKRISMWKSDLSRLKNKFSSKK